MPGSDSTCTTSSTESVKTASGKNSGKMELSRGLQRSEIAGETGGQKATGSRKRGKSKTRTLFWKYLS